jgi:uncharacterized coiled-coil protein SlyX
VVNNVTRDTIAALQAELAFQAEAIHKLNDALALQQQDLLLCRRQIELLSAQLRTLRDAGDDAGQDPAAVEIPPHY